MIETIKKVRNYYMRKFLLQIVMICKPSMENYYDDAIALDDDISLDDYGELFETTNKNMLF